jgi:type IV pilus assembly protein PilM
MLSLLRGKRIVGLDFDNGAIRGVELAKKNDKLMIMSVAQTAIPEEAFQEGMIARGEQVVAALENLWSLGKFKTRNVVIGISNQGVVIRFIQFPKVPANRLDGLVHYQAQEHLPIPLETAVLDYDVIGTRQEGGREQLEMLLVAGKKEMLDSFLQVLTAANLQPVEIEVLPLSLLRFLSQEESQQVVAVVDIGIGISNMLIADAAKPRLARMMPTGLKAAELLVAAAREPELGHFGGGTDQNEQLANNIRATIGYYQSHRGARPVAKILLSGKGSLVEGIAPVLEGFLGLPVSIIKPLEALRVNYAGESSVNFGEYGIAISLALRGWE